MDNHQLTRYVGRTGSCSLDSSDNTGISCVTAISGHVVSGKRQRSETADAPSGSEAVKRSKGSAEVVLSSKYYTLARRIACALTALEGIMDGALDLDELQADNCTPSPVKEKVLAEMRMISKKYISKLKVMLPSLSICEGMPFCASLEDWPQQHYPGGPRVVWTAKTESAAVGAVGAAPELERGSGGQPIVPGRHSLPRLVKYGRLMVVGPDRGLGVYTELLQRLQFHDMLQQAVGKKGPSPTRADWRSLLSDLVEATVKCRLPVAAALKPVVAGRAWRPTYGAGAEGFLPIQTRPAPVDYDTWLWVWGCRKIKVPGCYGPGPWEGFKWPEFLQLWVGPDGHPIRPQLENLLIIWRASLHALQMQLWVQGHPAFAILWRPLGVVDIDPLTMSTAGA